MQYLITTLIIIAVVYILFKNIKKSAKGSCSCSGTCSAKCPKIKDSNCGHTSPITTIIKKKD
ncbi:MAG: FeoB-associated Cys-rich membrane protein [Sarcina sp.]